MGGGVVTRASAHGLTTLRQPDWRDDAACRREDPAIFFASPLTAAGQAAVKQAVAICRDCPVIQQCGRWAYETRQPFGVWGGLSETERRAMLRRHGVRIKDTDPDTETEAAA